ncbi:hypothetical protein Avbf_12190 [Armadillidium vulgare]|nr:hypothetical protein Avbf_12190 [Armadillidium vulgare]
MRDRDFKPILNKMKWKIDKDEETANYDSSKFFKRNIFRGDDTSGGSSRGRGFEGRGRGLDGRGRGFEGRGRSRGGRGRGSFRDVDRKFGGKMNFENKHKQNFRDRDFGNQDNFSKNGEGQFFRGRGRGRGHFGNKDRWESSSKDRELQESSGRGRGRGNRGGFVSRGRNEYRNKSSDFSGSSNFAPLGKRKISPNKKENGSLLHPSWAAKKLQMEQLGKTTFQGKKIVFDD